MQTIKYFLIILIAFSFSSCENFFETTLELDPPPFEKQLVVFAELNTNEDALEVTVTENFGILDNDEIFTLTDPTIVFTINGNGFFDIDRKKGNRAYIFTINLQDIDLEPGDVCRIMVTHEGFPIATSTQTVPQKVEISSLKYSENGGLDTEGSEKSKVDIKFSDPVGKNFYETYVKSNSPQSWSDYYYTTINEPGASESLNYYGVIFNDLAFEGKGKDLSLLIDRTFESQAREFDISVIWRSATEDYYKYVRTAKVHYENSENPFATPADVYSNINGGLGIFYIVNEAEYFVF